MQPVYIVRGSTPTIQIKFKTVDVRQLTKAVLVIKQCEMPVIALNEERCTIDEESGSISFKLTQTETLELNKYKLAVLSCDWLCNDGTRGRSKELACRVEDPANEGVIENE